MIEGENMVVEAFGYFPTFHDGEILDLHLTRNSTPETDYPTVSITFTLHGWEMTSEITETGHYRLTKHHLITFRFDHIDRVDLRCFNHQNVLSELSITKIDHPDDHAILQVAFGGCFGLEGGFRAVTGSVVQVIPCDEDGHPSTVNG